MSIYFALAVFLIAACSAAVLTSIVGKCAFSFGLAKGPTSSRHIHNHPVPRLGGVALFFAVAIGVAVGVYNGFGTPLISLLSILLPAAMIFVLGLIDDLHPLQPWTKFAAQAVAATVAFLLGLRVDFNLERYIGGSADFLVAICGTVFWILLITNAFNLIDGLDGLASSVALISLACVVIVSSVPAQTSVFLVVIATIGAASGFLPFNFFPARIFLGDSGSMLLGFLVACATIAGGRNESTSWVILFPLLACGLPALDVVFSVARRLLRGVPLFSADRNHVHHKLLELGLTHVQAVLVMCSVAAVLAALTVLVRTSWGLVAVPLIVAVGIWYGLYRLGYHEFYELLRLVQRAIVQRFVIANNLDFRHAMDELRYVESVQELCFVLERALVSNEFDGFELQISGPIVGHLPAGDRVAYSWKRPRTRVEGDHVGYWRLEMECSPRSDSSAKFIFLRQQDHRAILLDLNTVTTLLASALTETVTRIAAGGERRKHKANGFMYKTIASQSEKVELVENAEQG
jgi:UDP-GlcNAc:undecaprenyl-phosphate/decaprenyl-phosphate GlcNAc-1-phosphate transferase